MTSENQKDKNKKKDLFDKYDKIKPENSLDNLNNNNKSKHIFDESGNKNNFSKSGKCGNKENNKESGSLDNKTEIQSKKKNSEDENNNFFDQNLSEILPVGLKNLGSSCFMNACLQCFFHCSSFIKELLRNHKKYEQTKGDITSAFLLVSKNLYKNGKFSNNKKYNYSKVKYYIDKYNYYTYFENETNPTSACDFFNYILTNYANAYNHGSDPKIVAELILSKMANEIGPEIIYNPPKNIRKTDEISFFLDIYNYFDSLKENIIVSNFYWIREKECICSECNKSTFNFQLNYIHYFYPEVILNRFSSGYYKKYNLCIETCFKYFTKSDQDMTSFACKVCNKRVKPKSILNYMVTLPKYLIFCLFVDKNVVDPINYRFDYGKDIDLKYYFKNIEGNNKTCTLYKFQSGCYSTWNSIHSLAFSYHFDGNLYEFNDSYYKQISDFKELYKENPYLLFYRRADIDLC